MSAGKPKQNVAASLNISYILERLDEGFCFTESSAGQDLFLVVGSTGVGKSTTCNYLLGHPMKERFHEGLKVVETAIETEITIGHEISAETLYAKGIMAADPCFAGRRVCLVDCPGFLGNRTIEECVVESISTELAIRSGRQVQGVLVLLSLFDLLDTKLLAIHELLQTLMALFKNPLEMVNHSVFVVTKNCYPSVEEGLGIALERLKTLMTYAQEQALELQVSRGLHSSSGFSVGDYDKIAGFFSAVLSNEDRVVVVDPMDNGQSRTRIFQQINRIQPGKDQQAEDGSAVKKAIGSASTDVVRPITINDFNFSDYNKHRVAFNKAVFFRVAEGSRLMKKIESTSERILNINTMITESDRRVAQLRELRSNLEEEIDTDREGQTQQRYKSVKTFEIRLGENGASRVAKEREIEEGKQKRSQLEKELGELDVDAEKLFCRDPARVFNRPWWIKAVQVILGLGLETVREFEFNTGDPTVPIINVKKDKDNLGKWRNVRDMRRTGSYSIDYVADFLSDDCWAWVEVYIRNKDDAGVRVRIQQIRDELGELDAKQSEKVSELEKLGKEAETLRSSIQQSRDDEEGYRRSLRQRLDDCDRDISCCKKEIEKLLREKEESWYLQLKLLQEFADNRPKLDMIATIDRLLEFPSTLVQKFIADFDAFVSRLDYYASISDVATDQTTLPSREDRAPEECVGAIKDLVLDREVEFASNELSRLEMSASKPKEAFICAESIKRQDLVLVVGCSGVGKSTTCNYLVGHPMRRRFHEGLTVVETADETDITIGHEISAETTCAKSIIIEDPCCPGRQVCLVDCPGFNQFQFQSVEEYAGSIKTELTAHSGRHVKGILVLLSYLGLIESKMHEIPELMKALTALFQNPIETANHSVLVVTKNMQHSAEECLAVTLARLEVLMKNAELLGLAEIAGFFSAVLRNRNNLVILDPLDNGESRKEIFQRISLIENDIRLW